MRILEPPVIPAAATVYRVAEKHVDELRLDRLLYLSRAFRSVLFFVRLEGEEFPLKLEVRESSML